MSLSQAARTLPCIRGSKSPHPNTLYRWATLGCRSRTGKRVFLDIILLGGDNCTSTEALKRFFDGLNDAEPTETQLTPPQTSLEKQAEQAKRILRQRGLIK